MMIRLTRVRLHAYPAIRAATPPPRTLGSPRAMSIINGGPSAPLTGRLILLFNSARNQRGLVPRVTFAQFLRARERV